MSINVVDLHGKRFSRLFVIGSCKRIGRDIYWECKCDCGAYKLINAGSLKSGATKSCGCLSLERKTKHGMCGTKEYKAFQAMHQRCTNKNNPRYSDWGGRGIYVCDEWESFEQFLSDMGKCPNSCSLERIDNDGPYSKENCVWALLRTQSLNKRHKIGKSGHVGIYWFEKRKKWIARIKDHCKMIHIGCFKNIEDAILARKSAEAQLR